MMRGPIRLLLAALLGVGAAVLVSCGSSGVGLIPVENASPLERDFQLVAQVAQEGDGNCSQTEAALRTTERDFQALPGTVNAGLHSRLAEGIAHLRKTALAICTQALAQTTTTGTSSTATSTVAPTSTTPAKTQTTSTGTTPPATSTTTGTGVTPPTTSQPSGSGGGTAPGVGGDESQAGEGPVGGGQAGPGDGSGAGGSGEGPTGVGGGTGAGNSGGTDSGGGGGDQ